MPRINGERLLGDLRRIADFGRYQTGVHRPHLSPQDVESRHWLAGRMKEAGLEPVIDGVGNVIGRSPKTGPRLLMGSHTDTQPRGGWLDGVMGVIYGLEVARALAEDPDTAHLAVDVASWADEEGHWGGMIGSKSFIGRITEADIDAARHRDDGSKMRDALKAAGLDKAPRIELEEGRYRCYLEAHIEQGGVLEHTGKRIGVVTAIVGIYAYRLTFSGIQNHAGTTPMPIRKDAGVAMMRLYHEVMERFPALAGPRSVWTVGKMSVEPGAPAIIPGKAEMILQFRDADVGGAEAPGSLPRRDRRRAQQARALRDRVRQPQPHHAGAHGGAPAGGARRRGRKARRRPAHAHAVRRGPRRPDPGPAPAVGHDVRAVDRRHLASLHGEHGGRGHRAGLPGVRRRCGEDPEGQLILAGSTCRAVHALQSSMPEEFPQFPHFALPPPGSDPGTHFARLLISRARTCSGTTAAALQVRAALVPSQREIR